ncbi:LemA family protein [Nonomuraea sp. NPDC050540]|uniref:LemA family protein n=1 Tax=Nonomuraea sp. NPDC050540 TaxID=3364367 RepID=UPI0037BB4414
MKKVALYLTLLALLLLSVLLVVLIYNSLVVKRNAVDNAWSQIDVQLKRRHDLIPNLVRAVQGYAAHERRTLEAVLAARSEAVRPAGPERRAQAESALSAAIGGVMAIAEAYPQLRAGENFAALQEELATGENRIAYARQYYNDAVLAYNNALHTVPSNLVAGLTGHREREYFRTADPERGPVEVRF